MYSCSSTICQTRAALAHDIIGAAIAERLDRIEDSIPYSVSIIDSFRKTWPAIRNLRVPMTFAGVHVGIDAAAKQIVEIRIE